MLEVKIYEEGEKDEPEKDPAKEILKEKKDE